MRVLIQCLLLHSVLFTGCAEKESDSDTAWPQGESNEEEDEGEEAEDVDSAQVYAMNCSGCHGADGGGVSGPDLTVSVPITPDEQLLEILRNGIGSMAAPNLTTAEEDALLLYLREQFGGP